MKMQFFKECPICYIDCFDVNTQVSLPVLHLSQLLVSRLKNELETLYLLTIYYKLYIVLKPKNTAVSYRPFFTTAKYDKHTNVSNGQFF